MAEQLAGLKRTCRCAELTKEDVGKTVTVMGWVHARRDLGALLFAWIRDVSGVIQAVFSEDFDKEAYEKASALRHEFVVAVTGKLVLRDPSAVNRDLKTGEIEINATSLKILNASEVPPFHIDESSDNVNDALRLTYRYLDLRRPEVQKGLIMRHEVAQIARNYFSEQQFLEIETPILTKSTPEGARDYLVPSRVHPGKFYALPQSPQLYKQLLMIAGMDRYFQLARCFRDEDLRADRQPEFTQIDLEMSFVEADDVISVNEGFIKKVFKDLKGIDLVTPFPRMCYREAMERYGSDKPDTRFGVEIHDLSDLVKDCEFGVFTSAIEAGGSVRCITAPDAAEKFSRKDMDKLVDLCKLFRAKGMVWITLMPDGEIKSSIAKFFTEDQMQAIIARAEAKAGDVIMIVADRNRVVFDALGNLRLEIGKRLELINPNDYNFLWVTEFPLLEYDEEEGRYVAMHHPFTSPMDEDLHLLDTDPGSVRAKAYDIILNGVELGGGSIRIHSQEIQKKMFKAIGMSEEEAQSRFSFLLDAFRFGAPPHGGMAYGFDRLIMLLSGKSSIRDIIAFPKVQNASELMNGAPSYVDEKQLVELALSVNTEEE